MPTKQIIPLTDLGQRPPEAGRIRLGVKTGKAMKSLSTFRFTSQFRNVIDQLAALYGGEVKVWNDPKANPPNQFEVISSVSEIPVYILQDGLSCWYEEWAAGGCVRRCDGVECELTRATQDGYELDKVPCLCVAENSRRCDPHTRLQVVIPAVSFRGVWRLETKGWNAAYEMPGMFNMITSLTAQGQMLQAVLGIEKRQQVRAGRTRHFVVPRLSIEQTALQIEAGGAVAGALNTGTSPVATAPAALNAAPSPVATLVDDEPVEAELVDDELLEVEGLLRADATNFGLDEARYVAAISHQVGGDRARMRACSVKVRAGELQPVGFTQEGTVQWINPS